MLVKVNLSVYVHVDLALFVIVGVLIFWSVYKS